MKRLPIALLLLGMAGCFYYPSNPATNDPLSRKFSSSGNPAQIYRNQQGEVITISFNSVPSVEDAGLVHLEGLNKLEALYLHRTRITDAGLAHLEGLTMLKSLTFQETQITDAGLKSLKELTNLVVLDLNGTLVTDAGLVHLEKLSKLLTLDLQATKVTDAAVAELQKKLPNCSITN